MALSSAALANASQCHYIVGAEQLLVPGRVVLVGEIHGTQEMPQVLVALVGRAVEHGLPVEVGFELDPAAQVALERYMKTGDAKDRFAIVAPRVERGDGTSSVALLEAFTALRAMHVHTFTFAGGNTNRSYADRIRAASRGDAVTFALMGNAHAETKRLADDDEDPAGLVLREGGVDVRSIWVDFTRGAAYNRVGGVSGVHEEPATGSTMTPYTLSPSSDPAYDLAISVGEIHPSPPARQAPSRGASSPLGREEGQP